MSKIMYTEDACFLKTVLFSAYADPYLLPQIGSNLFLTAAHCVQDWDKTLQRSSLTLLLGVQRKSQLTSRTRCNFFFPVSSSLSRKFHITDVKIHEDYDYILQQNDIALIKSSRLCLEHGKNISGKSF